MKSSARVCERSHQQVEPNQKGRRGMVDDHNFVSFREGLSRLLTSEPDFANAGNCGTSHEVSQILEDTRVEMILLDFDTGDHGGQFIVAAGNAGYGGKILMVTAGMSARVFRRFEARRVWHLPQTQFPAISCHRDPPGHVRRNVGRPKGQPAHGRPGSAGGTGQPRTVAQREGAQVHQGVFEGLPHKQIAAPGSELPKGR